MHDEGSIFRTMLVIMLSILVSVMLAFDIAATGDGYGVAYNNHESLAAGRAMTYIGDETDAGTPRYCFVAELPRDEGARLRMGCIPKTDVLNLEGASVPLLNVELWRPVFGQEVLLSAMNVGDREGFLITPTIVEISVTIPTTTG